MERAHAFGAIVDLTTLRNAHRAVTRARRGDQPVQEMAGGACSKMAAAKKREGTQDGLTTTTLANSPVEAAVGAKVGAAA
jgi:hypothetical protein